MNMVHMNMLRLDMLYGDVFRFPPLQSQRVASPQPRVQQSFPPLHESFLTLQNHAPQQVSDSPPAPQT
jgi:hypothetical protein